jgi:hypothetical protein
MTALAREVGVAPRRHRLLWQTGVLITFLALAAGCTSDPWQRHSVAYAVQVLGQHASYTVYYTTAGDYDFHEETPEGPIWQTRVTGLFSSVLDIELQIRVEPVEQSDLPIAVPLPVPRVSCGIVIDGEVRDSNTYDGYQSRCVAELPSRPDEQRGDAAGFAPFLFPAGTAVGTAVAAFWTYRRRRRPTRKAVGPEPPGYERHPHFRFMMRCGRVGLAILAAGLFLSFWLDSPLTLPPPPAPPPVQLPLPEWPQSPPPPPPLPGGG